MARPTWFLGGVCQLAGLEVWGLSELSCDWEVGVFGKGWSGRKYDVAHAAMPVSIDLILELGVRMLY